MTASNLQQILSLSNPLATIFGYFNQLHPASWNGVPFFVEGNDTGVGRRNAEHIYPFRDTPWQEDVGRRARKYNIVGFLVGDDVIAQRNAMQSAAETKGPGQLVHPTYGSLTLSLIGCQFVEDKTTGRVIKINFQFSESGQKLFPTQGISTTSNVANVAGAANQAVSDDYASQVGSIVMKGGQVALQTLRTVSGWVGEAETLGNDSTNIFHLASDMSGSFGRFFGGATGAGSGSIAGSYVSPSQISSQIANLVNTGTQDRANIGGAAANVLSVGNGL